MSFKTFLKESSLKRGDLVVIHTSNEYTPEIKVLNKDAAKKYFSEDTGWDEIDIKNIFKLNSNETYTVPSIHIIKI